MTSLPVLYRHTARLLFTILLLNWSGLGAVLIASTEPAKTAANASTLEEVLKKIESAIKADGTAPDTAKTAPDSTSRKGFDVSAKATELGKDVDKIFAFVRDEVRFEAYPGVLRGARGTLMAKAGNSFDQAILLAALLGQNGFQVRYARGTLDEEKAALLVAAMLSTDPSADASSAAAEPPGFSAELKEGFDKLGQLTAARWVDSVHQLQAALSPKGKLWDDQPRSLPDLAADVRDHVWVEYRQDNNWIALDPAASVAGLKPGESLAKKTGTWESIPTSASHMVTIQVIREERGPDGLTTRELLRHEARAEELDAAEVSLRFDVTQTGAGWSATPVLLIDARTIRGRPAAGSGVAGAAPDLGARLFQRPGELPKKTGGEVTATWLEFKFKSPRGETETVRREIFDRIGAVARASHREKEAPLATLPEKNGVPLYAGSQYAFSFSSGPIDPELMNSYLKPHLAALREAYPLSRKLQTENRAPTEKEASQLQQLLGSAAASQLGSVARAFHEFSWQSLALTHDKRLWEHVRFYAGSPRLAIASMEPRLDEKGALSAVMSLDLRRNDLRVLGKEINPAELAWANVVRGSLDAVLEDTVLRLNLDARARINSFSSVAVLERPREKGNALEAIASLDEIANLKVPEAVRARMTADAGKGILLFASTEPIKVRQTERMAWWRIDATSGETLGITDTGLHQSMTENTNVIALLVVAVASAYYTFWDSSYDKSFVEGLKTGHPFNDMPTSNGSNGDVVR
jgi:transglutaminase-like putative cysteine protease